MMNTRVSLPAVTQILLIGQSEWLDVENLEYDPRGSWMGVETATFYGRVYSKGAAKSAELSGPVTSIAATFSPDVPE